jgi:hypothetical protein
MDPNEKAAVMAACLQAAATLLADQLAMAAAQRGVNPTPDTAECVRFARDMFEKSTGEPWQEETIPETGPDPRPRPGSRRSRRL